MGAGTGKWFLARLLEQRLHSRPDNPSDLRTDTTLTRQGRGQTSGLDTIAPFTPSRVLPLWMISNQARHAQGVSTQPWRETVTNQKDSNSAQGEYSP